MSVARLGRVGTLKGYYLFPKIPNVAHTFGDQYIGCKLKGLWLGTGLIRPPDLNRSNGRLAVRHGSNGMSRSQTELVRKERLGV